MDTALTEALRDEHGGWSSTISGRLEGRRRGAVVPAVVARLQLDAAAGPARGLRPGLLEDRGWNE